MYISIDFGLNRFKTKNAKIKELETNNAFLWSENAKLRNANINMSTKVIDTKTHWSRGNG